MSKFFKVIFIIFIIFLTFFIHPCFAFGFQPISSHTLPPITPRFPSFNNLNQYSVVGAQNYTYDGNGNLTFDGTNTYAYDVENRLSSVFGLSSSVYGYDGFGRRVSKTVGGNTTYFIYDGDQIIEERDASGSLVASYVNGNAIDEVLTMTRGAQTYYYFYDGLGSVSDITNNNGEVIESYSYDVYGNPNRASAIGNTRFFTGRELDAETGLYYYRARYYSPSIGRFLQRDEWPGEVTDPSSLVNKYIYCANNPVNWIDPFGWDKEKKYKPWWQEEFGSLEAYQRWLESESIQPVPLSQDPIFWILTGFRWRGVSNEPIHIGFDIPFTKLNIVHFGKMLPNSAKNIIGGLHVGLLFERWGSTLIHFYKNRVFIKLGEKIIEWIFFK